LRSVTLEKRVFSKKLRTFTPPVFYRTNHYSAGRDLTTTPA
jgi:hypothetical protein